jgi:hypothetical protein
MPSRTKLVTGRIPERAATKYTTERSGHRKRRKQSMDIERFDRITRDFVSSTSRRQTVRMLIGGVVGAVTLQLANRGNDAAARCRRPGKSCRRGSDCCSHRCKGHVCTCKSSQAACDPGDSVRCCPAISPVCCPTGSGQACCGSLLPTCCPAGRQVNCCPSNLTECCPVGSQVDCCPAGSTCCPPGQPEACCGAGTACSAGGCT